MIELLRVRLDLLVKVDEVRVSVTCNYLAANSDGGIGKNGEQNTTSTDKGFVVGSDITGEMLQNGGEYLRFATNPFEEGFHV